MAPAAEAPTRYTPENENPDATRRLKAISFPKNNVFYVLVPELAYMFKSSKFVENAELTNEEYWRARHGLDGIKRKMFNDTKIDRISIVPTGYCEGGCSYCYAKDGWDLTHYITNEQMDGALTKHGITEINNVIIYGGEPCFNWDAYERMMNHLMYDLGAKKICTVTSSFYDDETFKKLLKFIDHHGDTIAWSVSMDSMSTTGKYLRQYKGKDTYQHIFDRLLEMVKHTHSIGVRQTVSRVSPNPFDLIRELKKATGHWIPTTLDLVKYNDKMILTPDQFSKLLWDTTDFINEVYRSGDLTNEGQMFQPFSKFFEFKNLYSLIKNCDMGTARLTIMPDGGVSDCTEDVKLGHPEQYEKGEKEYSRVFDFKKACEKCDYKYMCNLTCFHLMGGAEEGNEGQRQYCDFQIFNNIEGVRYFIDTHPESDMDHLLACWQVGTGVGV